MEALELEDSRNNSLINCSRDRTRIFYDFEISIVRRLKNKTEWIDSETACIHNIIGHCNFWVRITAKLLTPLILCALILYMSRGTYSLETIPSDRFCVKNFPRQFYLLSEFSPEICWEEIFEEIFFPFFVLMSQLRFKPRPHV